MYALIVERWCKNLNKYYKNPNKYSWFILLDCVIFSVVKYWANCLFNSDIIVFENYPKKNDDIYLLEEALNQNIPIIVFESPSDGDFMNNFLRDKYQISSDKNLENLSYKFIKNENQ